jgi:tRNA nucleotidyltransferase/poly(A) polymerase
VEISSDKRKMTPNIPEPILNLLQEIGEVGGEGTYLVGGFVRDLLLKQSNLDIDIVIEGDAIRVAKAMGDRWNGTLHAHPQFGTATVTLANLNLPKIDFVTARRETYESPGALPIVAHGTITDDLCRRDFSINALAMRLDTNAFGAIVDKTGGLEDIEKGIVRVLHKRSFTDDPTRVFRACRYAGRYGFSIADTDAVLIREALPVLAKLSGERIRNEIDRILLEENAPRIVGQLTEIGVYNTISAGWEISPNFVSDFQTGQRAIALALEHLVDEEFQPELVHWMALFGTRMPIYQIEALSFRLVLKHQLRRLVSRAQASQHHVSLEKVTHAGFEKLGFPLSQNALIEYQNGKWCVVDADSPTGVGTTYVCGEGNLYRIETPLTAYRQLRQSFASLQVTVKPSEIYQLLKPYPIEALILASVDTSVATWKREKIRDYLFVLRKVQPFITGEDLIQLGKKPSSAFETQLWELFAAQLNGEITEKKEAYSRLRTFV